jgi:hypothetical protein
MQRERAVAEAERLKEYSEKPTFVTVMHSVLKFILQRTVKA